MSRGLFPFGWAEGRKKKPKRPLAKSDKQPPGPRAAQLGERASKRIRRWIIACYPRIPESWRALATARRAAWARATHKERGHLTRTMRREIIRARAK